MSDEAAATDRLRAAEAGVVAARAEAGSAGGQLRLAEALLELADELQDVENAPLSDSGVESLERSLECVSEIADVIVATLDPELDDVVLEALHQRCRLLGFLQRPEEATVATAMLRSRIGNGDEQFERALALYQQGSDAYDRASETPDALHDASRALERLCAPYADALPPPPDSVAAYVAAGFTMSANIAFSQGQPAPARAMLELTIERFGDHPDDPVQAQVAYARQRLAQVDSDAPA